MTAGDVEYGVYVYVVSGRSVCRLLEDEPGLVQGER